MDAKHGDNDNGKNLKANRLGDSIRKPTQSNNEVSCKVSEAHDSKNSKVNFVYLQVHR